jgi:cobalt-zinc-cadmium efflux system outer membrane protein
MLLSLRAVGMPAQARPLTIEEAVALALRQNRDIGVARAAVDSAVAEVGIARALPNPSYVATPNTPYQYGATLALDVGPQRVFRSRVSSTGAEAAREDVRDAARQVTLEVKHAFYDVLLADARRTLVAGRREIVRQIFASDSVRVRAGDIPERNLTRSEVEVARADADLARAGVDAENARLALQFLMGVAHPDTALAISGTLAYRPMTVPADSLVQLAMRQRPDLAASESRVRQSHESRKLAAASLVPIPQLSYARQFTAPFESGHYYSFGIAFEVPLLNQYAGLRERAAASAASADAARQRLVLQTQRDVSSALNDYRAERSLVVRYESGLIGKIDTNVAAARYAYERGATSLLDVLDATRAQQDVLTDYYTALHDYWVSVATLDAAVGGLGIEP